MQWTVRWTGVVALFGSDDDDVIGQGMDGLSQLCFCFELEFKEFPKNHISHSKNGTVMS